MFDLILTPDQLVNLYLILTVAPLLMALVEMLRGIIDSKGGRS